MPSLGFQCLLIRLKSIATISDSCRHKLLTRRFPNLGLSFKQWQPRLCLANNISCLGIDELICREHSSVVEHSTADREVTGSNPVVPYQFFFLFFFFFGSTTADKVGRIALITLKNIHSVEFFLGLVHAHKPLASLRQRGAKPPSEEVWVPL